MAVAPINKHVNMGTYVVRHFWKYHEVYNYSDGFKINSGTLSLISMKAAKLTKLNISHFLHMVLCTSIDVVSYFDGNVLIGRKVTQ